MLHGFSIPTSDASCPVCDTFQLCLSIFHCMSALLCGHGEPTAGGTRCAWTPLNCTLNYDHLQWWQADDCSDLSRSCVSVLSQFGLLRFTTNVSCSVPGFHWGCFLVSMFFTMWGTWTSLEHLLLVTTTACVFSFLLMMQLPVIYKQSVFSVLCLLFICWEALTPLFPTYTCFSPGNRSFHLALLEHRPLSACCLVFPSKLPCSSRKGAGRAPCLFFRQPCQCN